MDAEPNLIRNANDRVDNLVGGDPLETAQHAFLLNKGEDVNAHVSLDGPKLTVIEDQSLRISGPLETQGLLDGLVFSKLNAETLEDKTVRDSSRSNSTSILDKIFGSTLSTKNDGHSGSAEVIYDFSKFIFNECCYHPLLYVIVLRPCQCASVFTITLFALYKVN